MNKEITQMGSHIEQDIIDLLQAHIELSIILERYNGPDKHTKERWEAVALAHKAEAAIRGIYYLLTKENQ